MVPPCLICGKQITEGRIFPDLTSARRFDYCFALGVPNKTFDHIKTRRKICFSHFDEDQFHMGRHILKRHALPRKLTDEEKAILLHSNFDHPRYQRPKEKILEDIHERLNGIRQVNDFLNGVTSFRRVGNPRTTSPALQFDINGSSPPVNCLLPSTSQASNQVTNADQKAGTMTTNTVLFKSSNADMHDALPSTSKAAGNSGILQNSNSTKQQLRKPYARIPSYPKSKIEALLSRVYNQPSTSQANKVPAILSHSNGNRRRGTNFSNDILFKAPYKNILSSRGIPTTSAAINDYGILENSNGIKEVETNSNIISKQVLRKPTITEPVSPVAKFEALLSRVSSLPSMPQSNNDNSMLNSDQEVDISSNTNLLLQRCIQYSQFLPLDSNYSDKESTTNSMFDKESETKSSANVPSSKFKENLK